MIAADVRTWDCIFGCPNPVEATTVAERYAHCLERHLDQLKHASAQTLNEIVTPKR